MNQRKPNLNTQGAVYEFITHKTDGPITAFVLMGRATDAVAMGATSFNASNALYEAMIDWGFLPKSDCEIY